MDIDFEALANSTDDEMLKSLDQFFDTMAPTRKNDYTGMLKGYNLISICAESFCPYFISEELTPTLYKLSNTGIIFENYYGTFQSVTTNGEYTMNMGLYPDMSRTKTQSSFDVSSHNYLPFCLGNALKNEGYQTWPTIITSAISITGTSPMPIWAIPLRQRTPVLTLQWTGPPPILR